MRGVDRIGAKYLVLHPGAHMGVGTEMGLKRISNGINQILDLTKDCKSVIAIETMAGKGTECGKTFEEIKTIIDGIDNKNRIGVCLDTCHIHDAGYDLSNFDAILDEFDQVISLDRLLVVHLNDSKNVKGAHKDRHANLGLGEIGFDILNGIAHNERIKDVPKILETPYIDGKAPYKEEIDMLKNQEFRNIE